MICASACFVEVRAKVAATAGFAFNMVFAGVAAIVSAVAGFKACAVITFNKLAVFVNAISDFAGIKSAESVNNTACQSCVVKVGTINTAVATICINMVFTIANRSYLICCT